MVSIHVLNIQVNLKVALCDKDCWYCDNIPNHDMRVMRRVLSIHVQGRLFRSNLESKVLKRLKFEKCLEYTMADKKDNEVSLLPYC